MRKLLNKPMCLTALLIMTNFDIHRDTELINTCAYFWCSGHAAAVPIAERSVDTHYCRRCYASLHEDDTPKVNASEHWDDTEQVFFIGGFGYGVARDLRTVSLGYEAEVMAYLNGNGVFPEKISGTAKQVLIQIRKLKIQMEVENASTGNNKVESSHTKRIIRTGGVRTRLTSNAEYKPVNTRHLKKGQRFPGRTSKPTKSGVPGGFGAGLVKTARS